MCLGCVVAAVAGHFIGLGWIGRSPDKSTVAQGVADSAARGFVGVRLVVASAARPVASDRVPSAAVPTATAARAAQSTPQHRVPSSPQHRQPWPPVSKSVEPAAAEPTGLLAGRLPEPVAAETAIPSIDTSVATAHFYTFDEVELPAAPVSDWELDAATLDGARIARIVFDLYVADDGSVVGCDIVEPPTLDDALRASLEARLRSTVLLPAVRTGRPVDSVRRIELTVS